LRLDGTYQPKVMIVFSLDATDILGTDTEANMLAAIQYQTKNPCNLVVFTGGIFNQDKGQYRSAARMMQEFWGKHFRTGHRARTSSTPSILIEEGSKTTRQNIANVVRQLAQRGYDIRDCEVYVVSERWHLMGIAYLFKRLYGVRVKCVPSNFRESLIGICGRVIRLILYRLDSKGTGWLSRHKIKRRGG